MGDRRAWGAALLRVTLGGIYLAHAWFAYAVVGVPAAAGLVRGLAERLGQDAGSWATPLAWYVVGAHAVGGFLLVIGLWTPWAALAQVPVTAGAVLIHWPGGFFVRRDAIGFEYALLVLVATVALLLIGPGALAVDRGRGRGR